MLKDLSFGEPHGVAPQKLETLPQPVARAYDKTPLGEARTMPVAISDPGVRYGTGIRLVALLKKYAKESPAGIPTIPFKASFMMTDEGITLYWQKKAVRAAKPEASPEPVPEKAKKGGKG